MASSLYSFFKRFKSRSQLFFTNDKKLKDDGQDEGYRIVGDKTKLKIGTRVAFGGNVLLYINEEIEIGNDTMIGINTVVHTSTHDYNNHPMWQQRIDRPVRIGNHVWIGLNVIILPGVVIEDYAVIGAGSVVNGVVPVGAIVAGNPARIIKQRDLQNANLDTDIPYPGIIKKGGYLNKIIKNKNLTS